MIETIGTDLQARGIAEEMVHVDAWE